MVKILIAVALVCLAFTSRAAAQNAGCSKSTSAAALDMQRRAQAALAAKAYGRVEEELKSFVAAHPEECDLSLILGQAYLYRKKDRDAESQFRSVLKRDGGNRMAKLELARLYGYHARYVESNRLYGELIDADPLDENASIGLVRNLIETDEIAKAKAALKAGLTAHPNSLRLQEYQDQLAAELDEENTAPKEIAHRPEYGFQDWTYIITDSAGDNIVENLSRSDVKLSSRFFAHATTRVRHLSSNGGVVELPDANAESEGGPTVSAVTFQATARFDYHLNRWLTASGGVGGVRFNNGTSKMLFRGSLEAHHGSSLYLKTTYIRTPVLPTQEAETFHLTAQGFRTRFDWTPPKWRVHAGASELKYSDTNRRHEQDVDALRWFGVGRIGVGAGFSIDHLSFDQLLNHGYFSPGDYQNYMGAATIRLQHYHHFNAEYKVNTGSESIEPSPFRFVFEVAADNFLRFGKWDFHVNYTFDHITQSTGAFQTSFTSLGAQYKF